MAERIQKQRSRDARGRYTSEKAEPKKSETADELKAALDALLDEVDAVLEENAEEFVKGYIQKGGQ